MQFLSTRLPFDEVALLEENIEYLQRSLQLEALRVHQATPEAAAAIGRTEILKAEPGAPATILIKEQ